MQQYACVDASSWFLHFDGLMGCDLEERYLKFKRIGVESTKGHRASNSSWSWIRQPDAKYGVRINVPAYVE